jgi:hypothetical protein
MAKGIQDLGIGLGYLYKTKPDGVTIVAVEKNTADGVRSMKTQGTTNGPVIADRPAVGTITVNSVASVGAITAITIGGVNQIGANINVVSSTASVVAAQIADAINRYSPVGSDDFTAQAVGAVIYVFSPSNTGSTSNGLTITVTATDPSINTSTTPLNNGSSQNAVYDTTFGYRFFIDADYGSAGTPGGGTATPSSLTYAAEITQYMTLRGLQSGIYTTTATIASDSVTSLTRCSAITQVLLSNQGGAASDVLAFIQTEGFAVGDELQLSAASPGTQVPTLESAPTTSSTVGTPNLYLTDDASFVMDSYTSITLQLRNIPGTGLAWVETGRSLADGFITTTIAGISTLSGASDLRPKGLYYVTDLGDAGTYVMAVASNLLSAYGTTIRRVPQNYTSCWRSTMALPTLGQYYRYYQNVYQSVTGAIGTAPSGDTVNWLLIAKTNNTYYQSTPNLVGLNVSTSGITGAWPIVFERDAKNNMVSQSARHFGLSVVNAYNVFPWKIISDTTVYGNTVVDAVFDCANSDGTVYGNTVTSNTNFSSNTFATGSVLGLNRMEGGVITDNFITAFIGNFISNESTVTNNGTSGAFFYQFGYNEIIGGNVTNNTSATAGDKEIVYTRVEKASSIQNNAFRGASSIAYSTVKEGSQISGSTFYPYSGTRNLSGVEVKGGGTLTVIDTTTSSGIRGCTIDGGSITLRPSGAPVTQCKFVNSTFDVTIVTDLNNSEFHYTAFSGVTLDSVAGMTTFGISNTGTPTLTGGGVITAESSNYAGILDLDDAGVFAAGVLTIADNLQFCGVLYLQTTANRNITSVVGLPANYEVRFISSATGNTITFTTTAKAGITGNQIAGAAASYVLASNVSGTVDQLWMNKPVLNTVTRASILI